MIIVRASKRLGQWIMNETYRLFGVVLLILSVFGVATWLTQGGFLFAVVILAFGVVCLYLLWSMCAIIVHDMRDADE